jgi:hypothetical protein
MAILYEFEERIKPLGKESWLKEQQKQDFESTYFDDEETALTIVSNLINENGLKEELNKQAELPYELNEVDFNPMMEALENWNDFKRCNWK